MKKLSSIVAVVALIFTMNVSAQEPKKAKKAKAKTEKAVASEEKKGCAEGEKKAGCCSKK